MSPTDPPAGPPPGEPTQPLDAQAIGRELDRISRWVQKQADEREWTDELRKMWDATRECFDGLSALAAATKPAPSRAWLLQVGEEPEKLSERLTSLVEWLDKVFLRYPAAQLPSCWSRHPWLVEELLWLQAYHSDAYGPRGSSTAQGMWHDQSLPRLLERMKHVTGCDLSKHVPGGQEAKPPLAAPLAGHIKEIAEAWSTTGLPPEPSTEQLEEARKHRELKLRRNTSNTN
jgi:hypothetical protein